MWKVTFISILLVTWSTGSAKAQDFETVPDYVQTYSDVVVDVPIESLDRTVENDANNLMAELTLYFKRISDSAEDSDRVRELRQLRIFRTRLTGSEAALRSGVDSVRSSLSSIQRDRLVNLRNLEIASNQIESIEGYIRRLPQKDSPASASAQLEGKAEAAPAGPSLEQATADLEKERLSQKTLQAALDTKDAAISDRMDFLTSATTLIQKLGDNLNRVDDQSLFFLQAELEKNKYTSSATYVFGILVGAVILGFFLIAFFSAPVRTAIFAGDSGIQFVTLFSLVIAIILFGVLGILEGKELSALLGGLSGYILGRSSGQSARPSGPMKTAGQSETSPEVSGA